LPLKSPASTGNSAGIFIATVCGSEQEAQSASRFSCLVAQRGASLTQAKEQADT